MAAVPSDDVGVVSMLKTPVPLTMDNVQRYIHELARALPPLPEVQARLRNSVGFRASFVGQWRARDCQRQ